MFKQQNPFSNHEILVLFEHGFWPTSLSILHDVTVFRRNKMADVKEALLFFGEFL